MSFVPRLQGRFHAVALLICSACSAGASDHVGSFELGLTSQAGDVSYRLSRGQFTLDGPDQRTFSADGQDQLELELAAGSYRLTLQDDYALTRSDMPDAGMVMAQLISQNPAPIQIRAGQTTRTTLRFEISDDAGTASGDGTLQVGIAVGSADGGMARVDDCALGLRINELDYEQPNTDDAEFIEILNTSTCTATLQGVTLELVNGGDDKVYTRYALSDATPTLAAGERLVIGDVKVVSALPAGSKHFALNGSGLQNGPDGMRIMRGMETLDAVAYEGQVPGSGEGDATAADDGASSLSRCPDGFDTDDNKLDFALTTPTPGADNVCP